MYEVIGVSFKGPNLQYHFLDYQCKCKQDKTTGLIWSTEQTNISADTHRDGYCYIIYDNNSNGKSACDNKGKYYIKAVGEEAYSDFDGKKHGIGTWDTNSGSGTMSDGWYNNFYKGKIDKDKTPKAACDWACQSSR